MAKWKSWVGPETEPPSNQKTISSSDAPERQPVTYERYEDIPKPVRDTLKQAHESGLTVQHLHKIFELPVEWIERAIAGTH